MKFVHLALAAVATGAVLGFLRPANADPMPMDQPVTMNGIQAVCTGVGSAEDNPQWNSYPVRVEFSNGGAQYLSGAHVTLSQGGKTLTALDCAGPWVLFQLKPGSYKVTATITDQPGAGTASAKFSPPAHGQARVVIRFPTPSGK